MTNHPHRRPRGLDRRQFLIRGGLAGAAGLSLPALLAACGDDDAAPATTAAPDTTAATTTAPSGPGELFFENWPAYIDPTEDGLVGTVDRFVEATGISMRYTEAFNDNNEYFAVIQPILGRGDRIDPDIIAPTGWMAGRLINLGWVDPLPLDQVPNAANLRADLRNPAWDPTGEYSLPWQTGFAGIAYNPEVTGREIRSVADLFDPAFAGKIGMLTEMRDTMGLLMLGLGVDISNITSFDQAAAAFEQLEAAKDSGQIRRFHGNDYFDDLSNGNFAACIAWSGDVAQLQYDDPRIQFVFPEEGATSWADTMVMPKGAVNRPQAAAWMNFVYDPAQAAQIAAWVQYVSPVAGVREEIDKIDPELAANPLIFPDDAVLSNVYPFASLSEDVEAEFDAAFSRITGA